MGSRTEANSGIPTQVGNAARRRHDEGYHCAESVLLALTDTFPREDGDQPALRMATGFGGGIGRSGRTCGALTGGVLALGHLYGRTNLDDGQSYRKVAALTREILRDFTDEFGSTVCEELIGYNISDGLRAADDPGRREKCDGYIARAAELFARQIMRRDNGLH